MALNIRHNKQGFTLTERVDWEGGPEYWEQFPLADAAGWSDPSFFPIGVFLVKVESGHPAALASIGINVAMAAEYQPPISNLTDHMFAMIQSPISHDYQIPGTGTWSQADVGDDPGVVAWFIYDECEMGEGRCNSTNYPTDAERLAAFQGWTEDTRAFDDGRFMYANFGNGVLNSFWAVDTMDQWMGTVDACACDKYAYTSPNVDFIIDQSLHWPGTIEQAESASAYGWFVDQMRGFDAANPSRRPIWGFFETQLPYITESGRNIILYAEIEGAVWSAITHEARGICYFQHNGFYEGYGGGAGGPTVDPNTGLFPNVNGYSLVQGDAALIAYVAAINAKVASLATVLNTQSYVFNFGATGVDTMLKVVGGYAYIFTSMAIGGSTGSKTFTLPGTTGTTVEVIGESRTLPVTAGQFTDSFAAEYTHHVYKVAM